VDIAYREPVNIEFGSELYEVSNATDSYTILGLMDIFPFMTTAMNTSAKPQQRYTI
jgi:hypothetical protein